jgi:hypothetical protein
LQELSVASYGFGKSNEIDIMPRFSIANRILFSLLLAFFILSPLAPVQATVGLMVGADSLNLGSGENLYYGNFSASSNAGANAILLQKPAGTNIFRVDTTGSLIMAGSLTLPASASITNGPTYGTGALTFYNGPTSYLLFDIANARIENKLGKFYTSGGLGYFGTLDNYGLALVSNNSEKMRIDTLGNVGIMKTDPAANLDIVGSLSSSGTINGTGLCIAGDCKVSWSSIVSAGGGSYWAKTATFISPTTLTDNIGIGITNPSTKLQALLDTNNVDIIRASTAAHSIGLGVDSSATYWGASLFQDGVKRFTVESNNGILIGASYQSVDAPASGAIIEGSLGIGTTNPAIGLTVEKDNGNGWAALFRTSNSNAGLLVGSQSNSYTRLASIDNTLGVFKDLILNPSGGNIGIAKTNPGNVLDIIGGINTSGTVNATSLCIAGYCFTE